MERKQKLVIAGVAAGLVLVAVIAAPWFLPEKSVTLNQDMPAGASEGAEATMHRSGTWSDGDSAHKASGTIELVTIEGQQYLQFNDFQLTRGPDVYLYLTESASPRSTADVEGSGLRINVQTDEDMDSRLNERGSFFVPLELSMSELSAYNGVAAWCDDFNVLFGSASLTS